MDKPARVVGGERSKEKDSRLLQNLKRKCKTELIPKLHSKL